LLHSGLHCASAHIVCMHSCAAAQAGAQSVQNMKTPQSEQSDPAVHIDLNLGRFALEIRASGVVSTFEPTVTFKWADPRLFSSPCAGVLDPLLSITAAEMKVQATVADRLDKRSRFWFPDLLIAESVSNNPLSWSFAAAAQPDGLHTLTVVYNVEARQRWLFTYFPFDNQTIVVKGSVPNVRLQLSDSAAFGRTNPVLSGDVSSGGLLPESLEWHPYDDAWIQVSHPSGHGGTQLDHLEVRMLLKRNANVYLVKSLSMGLLVSFSGLLALWLLPTEQTGDRVAGLVVALLIIMTNLQTDLKLGDLTYLIWVDIFNLLQTIILVMALFETIYVHSLIASEKVGLALQVDRIARIAIAFGVWPLSMVSIFIYGLQVDNRVGYPVSLIVAVISIVGVLIGTLVAVQVYLVSQRRRKERVFAQISATHESDPRYAELLECAFRLFDEDESDQLEHKEVKELACRIFPRFSRREINKALQRVIREQSLGDQVSSVEFSGLVVSLNEILQIEEEAQIVPERRRKSSSISALLTAKSMSTRALERPTTPDAARARSLEPPRPGLEQGSMYPASYVGKWFRIAALSRKAKGPKIRPE